MADKTIPFSTYLFGAAGAAALVRGLWHPHRAAVDEGRVLICAGAECSPEMTLDCGERVYALGGGRIVMAEPGDVHLRVGNEPVIVAYSGLQPDVRDGQYVLRGQRVGACSGQVSLSVWRVNADKSLTPLEPAAWLASRGYRVAVKSTGDEGSWCEQGRKIQIPSSVHTDCGIVAGSEPGFALLPISVREA